VLRSEDIYNQIIDAITPRKPVSRRPSEPCFIFFVFASVCVALPSVIASSSLGDSSM
jgi:hypothetical protein